MLDFAKPLCGWSFHDHRGLRIAAPSPSRDHRYQTPSTPRVDLFQVGNVRRRRGTTTMKRTTGGREDRRVEVIKLSIPSRPVMQMTEKLQLVDAGLGERKRAGGLST